MVRLVWHFAVLRALTVEPDLAVFMRKVGANLEIDSVWPTWYRFNVASFASVKSLTGRIRRIPELGQIVVISTNDDFYDRYQIRAHIDLSDEQHLS